MSEEHTEPYHCQLRDGRYLVVDAEDRTVLESRDSATARHYVDLLNKAFAAGYRSGYRAGRSA